MLRFAYVKTAIIFLFHFVNRHPRLPAAVLGNMPLEDGNRLYYGH